VLGEVGIWARGVAVEEERVGSVGGGELGGA